MKRERPIQSRPSGLTARTTKTLGASPPTLSSFIFLHCFHMESQVLPKLEALMPMLLLPLRPVIMPRIPRTIPNEQGAEYFRETRPKRFGMSPDELEKSDVGGEKAWQSVKPILGDVASLLKDTEGAFLCRKRGYEPADSYFLAFHQQGARRSFSFGVHIFSSCGSIKLS